MATSTVICAYCEKPFEKTNAEINRSIRTGRRHLCSLSCTAKLHNRERRKPSILKSCAYCGSEFVTRTSKHEATFCSRSCASAGSVTDKRRRAAQLAGRRNNNGNIGAAKGLYGREKYKYEEVRKFLVDLGIRFKFEHRVENYVFDLALLDDRVLIEFDGRYHRGKAQQAKDAEKDSVARKHGFIVNRVETESGRDVVYAPALIRNFVASP